MNARPGLSRRRVRGGLILLVVAAIGAGPGRHFRKIKHVGVGFVGPGPTYETPETTPCTTRAYAGSVGFPFRNRSIVVDLGYPPPTVHRLVLVDDYSDNGGDSPTIRAHGLEIYTSCDNRTYSRYTGPCRLLIRSGKPEGGFDAVELNGLTIRARYIKLHADLPDDKWDFGNHDLRRMVRVFQANSDTLTLAGSFDVGGVLLLRLGDMEDVTKLVMPARSSVPVDRSSTELIFVRNIQSPDSSSFQIIDLNPRWHTRIADRVPDLSPPAELYRDVLAIGRPAQVSAGNSALRLMHNLAPTRAIGINDANSEFPRRKTARLSTRWPLYRTIGDLLVVW